MESICVECVGIMRVRKKCGHLGLDKREKGARTPILIQA